MERKNVSRDWQFRKLPNETIESKTVCSFAQLSDEEDIWVNLPHTYYTDEEQYRGLTMYRKVLELSDVNKAYVLEFLGADQICEVYVNQTKLCRHEGGYAAFHVEIPECIVKQQRLELEIYVDNTENENISPISGDFTIFGGLYREVYLLEGAHTHFDYEYYGTDGVIARTQYDTNTGVGTVAMEVHSILKDKQAIIKAELLERQTGKCCAKAEQEIHMQDEANPRVDTVALSVTQPHLWNGLQDPFLYTLIVELYVADVCVDRTEKHIGFRAIHMDSNQGFFLNGQHTKLNGVAKHQDIKEKFCAVTQEEIENDFVILSELGANALRLSHYQHPQKTYDVCDEQGYLVWAEIPMLKMLDDAHLLANTEQQLHELVLQNIHHPSIFCWGIQNEIGMFRDTKYMHDECNKLTDIAKKLDADRLVTCANLYNVKPESTLNAITDMVGYNLYFGWYYGEMPEYETFLDRLHEKNPTMLFGMSEYGVDANPQLHSENPMVRDYTEEFQCLFHETVYPYFRDRDFIWGSFVWNTFDFSSPRRDEGGLKFVNQKGLVTYDRQIKKDAFYYYKAQWSKEKFLHICSKRFEKRCKEKIDMKVYTNLPQLELSFADTRMLQQNNGNGTVVFSDIPLELGNNFFVVRGVEADSMLSEEVTFVRVLEEEKAYQLPNSGAGQMVRNWFLPEDTMIKEGYFSVEDSANDMLEYPAAFAVLKEQVPKLAQIIEEDNGLPLGFSLLRIMGFMRKRVGEINVKTLNDQLNQIKKP